ncbi:DMT family transporter [Thalassovita sp.]|jgi:drug/metabolite transporter (DMT)-like permease|uniref:DMT family transporter n=1 Tax=Thalassovita sp. TaxID=1979401 RepID=UPI003B5CFF6A
MFGPNTQGALLALLSFAIFSTHDVVVRVLGGTYSPIQLLFFTSLMSFPLVTIMLISDKTPGHLRPVYPWWMALRSVSMALVSLCAFYAFSELSLAQTYTILFASPLLITLMAIPILGEKVGFHRGIAVLVGLVGVIVVLRPGAEPMGLGHLAALLAALFNAIQSIIARRIGAQERSVAMMLYPLAATFVMMGAMLAFTYKPMPLPDLAGMAVIAVLGFIAAFCLVAAYVRAEAAMVAPMQYSQIIWAAIFGYVLFDEVIDGATILGASIVILSGIYIVLREALGGQSNTTPVLRTRTRGFSPGAFRISVILRRKS